MRPVGMTLAGLMLVALAAQAQPPAGVPGVPPNPGGPAAQPFPNAPPSAAPADPVLDQHLLGWEKAIQGVSNFYSEFELKVTDGAFKRDRMFKGSVLCMKPDFARMRRENTTNPADYEAYICDGRSVFEYQGLQKTITEFKLAPGGGSADNLMLDFLRGMKAADAKRRFQIAIFKPDPNYVYLDIKPLLARDQQMFEQIRFALYGPTVKPPYTPYFPAQMFMVKPSGDTESWTFKNQQTQLPKVDQKSFQFVPIPGWDVKQAPAQQPGPVAGGQFPPAPGQQPQLPPGAPPLPGAQQNLPGGQNLPAGPSAVRPQR
jgi:TIGR03009 family protein